MEIANWITLISGIFAGLGIGSALTAYVQYFLKKKESATYSQRTDLEKRYKVIILLMYAAFEFEDDKALLRIHRPDLKNKNDVIKELKAEWYNMLLFASERTQNSLYSFIKDPNLDNLKNTAISMRRDLGRGSLSEMVKQLNFENSDA